MTSKLLSQEIEVKVTITASEIQNAASTPISLTPDNNPIALGYITDPISIVAVFNWGSEAFTSSDILINVGNGIQYTFLTLLTNTETITQKGIPSDAIPAHMLIDSGIHALADSDSTIGDSTIDFYIKYRIINTN